MKAFMYHKKTSKNMRLFLKTTLSFSNESYWYNAQKGIKRKISLTMYKFILWNDVKDLEYSIKLTLKVSIYEWNETMKIFY